MPAKAILLSTVAIATAVLGLAVAGKGEPVGWAMLGAAVACGGLTVVVWPPRAP